MRNNKKLPYDNAELEVVKFSSGDVITTSGWKEPNDWSNVDSDGIDWSSTNTNGWS